eukprot:5669643-Alexandrium_andersonii.AAC.1
MMKRPVYRFKEALHGHPDAGTYWEQNATSTSSLWGLPRRGRTGHGATSIPSSGSSWPSMSTVSSWPG